MDFSLFKSSFSEYVSVVINTGEDKVREVSVWMTVEEFKNFRDWINEQDV